MNFGERLYELRKEKNISQEELAQLLDVSRQSISKWENDKAYPEMTRLLFMSEYFGVSLDYLMRGTESNDSSESDKSNESKQNTDITYKAENMALAWNTFVSNLSGTQRILLILLYILLICVCICIIFGFTYDAGYALGKTLYHLQN